MTTPSIFTKRSLERDADRLSARHRDRLLRELASSQRSHENGEAALEGDVPRSRLLPRLVPAVCAGVAMGAAGALGGFGLHQVYALVGLGAGVALVLVLATPTPARATALGRVLVPVVSAASLLVTLPLAKGLALLFLAVLAVAAAVGHSCDRADAVQTDRALRRAGHTAARRALAEQHARVLAGGESQQREPRSGHAPARQRPLSPTPSNGASSSGLLEIG